ncbi:MAG: restriction endonuclease, partial [Streptococcaceae bacterium]|nr:restriction endonuclease [Streptococcaceae bacterium]
MIFEPNQKELEVINEIHKYNTEDYVVIRLTKTMLNKEIMDANALLRFFFEKYDFVYYDNLSSGGKNGQLVNTEFISNDLHTEKIMNFYLANSRGDRRFSIRGIAELVRQGYINIDDLLYFS